MAVSIVLVWVIWQTTLRGLYGAMDLSTWVVLSVLLSLVALFYVKTDAM